MGLSSSTGCGIHSERSLWTSFVDRNCSFKQAHWYLDSSARQVRPSTILFHLLSPLDSLLTYSKRSSGHFAAQRIIPATEGSKVTRRAATSGDGTPVVLNSQTPSFDMECFPEDIFFLKKGQNANAAREGDLQMLPWGNIAALWPHHTSERLQRVRRRRSSRPRASSRQVRKMAHFSGSLRCGSRLPNIVKSYLNSIPSQSWQIVDMRGFRTRGLRSVAADAHHFNSAPWTLRDLFLLAASDPPFIPARIGVIQPPFGLFPV